MKKLLITGATSLLIVSLSMAQTSVNLDFNGSGSTLAATGFDNVINEAPSGYSVGGGKLSITTLPGDIYGDYDSPNGAAKNIFTSNLDTTDGTVVNSHVTVFGLNANFHGGGVIMMLDTDHYVRLGVINAGSNILVEGIRENEDLWTVRGGPGGDIVGHQSAALGASPQVGSLDIDLRLVRTGTNVDALYSLDGTNYTLVGSYADFRTTGGGFTTSSQLKAGVYAFGGPDNQIPATFAFDSFHGQAVPEPATLAALGLGTAAMLRRRKRA